KQTRGHPERSAASLVVVAAKWWVGCAGGAESKDLSLFLPASSPAEKVRGPSTPRRTAPPHTLSTISPSPPPQATRGSAQDDSGFFFFDLHRAPPSSRRTRTTESFRSAPAARRL